MLQLALVRKGAGVALVPEPSAEHYGAGAREDERGVCDGVPERGPPTSSSS